MPEGDSVYRQCKMLREALEGAVIESSDFRVPALATSDVAGPPPRYVQHLSVKDGVSVTQTIASDSAIGPFGILSVSDLM